MTAEVKTKMNKNTSRRVFNPLTGETLDNSFLKSSISITDRIDLLIEDGYQSQNEGLITRIFKK